MTGMVTCLGLAAILGALLADGKRQSILNDDHGDIKMQGAFDGVRTFLQASKKYGSAGIVAGQLVMNIESGVEETVTESEIFGESADLKLRVVHSKVSQGEIATPSKVPVKWVLDKEMTYTLQKNGNDVKLSVQGLTQHPFSEGLELYKKSGVLETCASNEDLMEKVKCEREAMYSFYKPYFKKTVNDKKYLSEPEHKLGRILKKIYTFPIYQSVYVKGGDEAWSKIIYSMVTIPKVTIDYFLLAPDPKGDEDKVDIAMFRHEIQNTDQANFGFMSKNKAEFDPTTFESDRKKGEEFSRSAMNFAAMTAKGNPRNSDLKGGTAKYILKFASPCKPKNKKYDYNDPTYYCKDDNGRIYWQ